MRDGREHKTGGTRGRVWAGTKGDPGQGPLSGTRHGSVRYAVLQNSGLKRSHPD